MVEHLEFKFIVYVNDLLEYINVYIQNALIEYSYNKVC